MSIHVPTSFVLVLVLCVVMELCSPFFFLNFCQRLASLCSGTPKRASVCLPPDSTLPEEAPAISKDAVTFLSITSGAAGIRKNETRKRTELSKLTRDDGMAPSPEGSRGEKVNNVSVITPEASHYHHGKGSAQQKSHEGQQLGGPETLPGRHIARKALGHFVQL